MRRLCLLMLGVGIHTALAHAAPAQDAAMEQRLNELSGRIETLLEGQEILRKQIADLSRDLSRVREQANRPIPESASPEDLKRLADAIREIDRKRLDDYEKIRTELLKLGRTLKEAATPVQPRVSAPVEKPKPDVPEKGFEYEVQKGDSLSIIIQAYREKNIKITTEQVLKANPGLKPELIRPGQKIFIPAPKE